MGKLIYHSSINILVILQAILWSQVAQVNVEILLMMTFSIYCQFLKVSVVCCIVWTYCILLMSCLICLPKLWILLDMVLEKHPWQRERLRSKQRFGLLRLYLVLRAKWGQWEAQLSPFWIFALFLPLPALLQSCPLLGSLRIPSHTYGSHQHLLEGLWYTLQPQIKSLLEEITERQGRRWINCQEILSKIFPMLFFFWLEKILLWGHHSNGVECSNNHHLWKGSSF